MSKAILIAGFIALTSTLTACTDITAPDVGPNEVGFINESSYRVRFTARYTQHSVSVGGRETAVLPWTDDGFMVTISGQAISHDALFIYPDPGETVVYRVSGNKASLSIK